MTVTLVSSRKSLKRSCSITVTLAKVRWPKIDFMTYFYCDSISIISNSISIMFQLMQVFRFQFRFKLIDWIDVFQLLIYFDFNKWNNTATATAWRSLPGAVTSAPTLSVFRQLCKTFIRFRYIRNSPLLQCAHRGWRLLHMVFLCILDHEKRRIWTPLS